MQVGDVVLYDGVEFPDSRGALGIVQRMLKNEKDQPMARVKWYPGATLAKFGIPEIHDV